MPKLTLLGRFLPALAAAWLGATTAYTQPAPLERLPADVLDAMPPSARVSGPPGRIAVEFSACRSVPRDQLRRRIVDLAIQEWGYFGFTTVDEASPDFDNLPRQRGERRSRWVDPEESARVVDSIAGYWTVTPDGSWILDRQNRIWRGTQGVVDRWRDPWSAAFISWLMCEGGLDEPSEFRRAVAHYVYIDQAIEARDSSSTDAAFVAHEVGDAAVEPGDLLCRGRRGAYRTLAERRKDLGDSARSHCDIVVRLDPDNQRILTIGGNVRGSVRLKFLAAKAKPGAGEAGWYAMIGRESRLVFAHLKLRAASIGSDALDASPTIRALSNDRHALRLLQDQLADSSLGGSDRDRLASGSAEPRTRPAS